MSLTAVVSRLRRRRDTRTKPAPVPPTSVEAADTPAAYLEAVYDRIVELEAEARHLKRHGASWRAPRLLAIYQQLAELEAYQ